MPRLIKRYENRKLYDTEASTYVSLSDVADLVRSGITVQIEDNATGRDLTAQTLMQVILEEGRGGKSLLPADTLHELLRRSSRALDNGIEQLKHSMDELIHSSVTQLSRLVPSPKARELEDLRRQLRQLETQVADLIREVDAQNAPSPEHSTEHRDASTPERE